MIPIQPRSGGRIFRRSAAYPRYKTITTAFSRDCALCGGCGNLYFSY
jgi:hypothetical protein